MGGGDGLILGAISGFWEDQMCLVKDNSYLTTVTTLH